MSKNRPLQIGLRRYYLSTGAFLVSLGLLLLTLVDIRRGFLFSGYVKVGAPSTLLNLEPRHLLLLLAGGLGAWLAYRYLARLEPGLRRSKTDLTVPGKITAAIIGVFLVIDLFTYRGVPASRIMAAGEMSAKPGTMGLGWAIPVTTFPGWLQPTAEGINYLLVVWHAIMLGILIGGLFLVAGQLFLTRLKGSGFTAHLAGAAAALPQPFCSCCAAPIGATMYRRGASLGPVLAFTVASPMLNITTLVLAAALLPVEFALLRIAGGITVSLFITYGVALMATRWVADKGAAERRGKLFEWSFKVLNAYNRLFRFEKLFPAQEVDSPALLISNWLGTAWRLAKVVTPLLIIFSVLAVYILQVMPDSGNNIIGVAVTAIFATLLMVPTWTEIPLALGLINDGLNGIAATVLITLPAVSLPSLLIITGAVGNPKVALALGLSVVIAGVLAGIIFL